MGFTFLQNYAPLPDLNRNWSDIVQPPPTPPHLTCPFYWPWCPPPGGQMSYDTQLPVAANVCGYMLVL